MSEPAILETATVPRPGLRPGCGVALICGGAMTVSSLIEGGSPGGDEAGIYAAVAAAILRHSGLSVLLHPGAAAGERASAAAIERAAGVFPNIEGRLRVVSAEPLAALLPGVDLLLSFASPSLIAGCRSGLKPVQIGRVVTGSAAFSHVFTDTAAFAAALAEGGVAGNLSLREYELFDAFCRRIAHGAATGRLRPLAARRLARDSIIRACRPSRRVGRGVLRSLASALSNPFAVWRLLRAGLATTDAG